jgi:hypothetical protein
MKRRSAFYQLTWLLRAAVLAFGFVVVGVPKTQAQAKKPNILLWMLGLYHPMSSPMIPETREL